MNFYPHHIGDYLTATVHLSWLEDLAYRRMLDLYYSRELPLPVETQQVCRLLRANNPEETQSVISVLNEFFQLTENGWHHKRCDEEIGKALAASERAKENGKKGGRPSKKKTKEEPMNNPEETQSVISGIPTDNPEKTKSQAPNPITNPITNVNPIPDGIGIAQKSKRAMVMPENFSPNEVGQRYAAERGLQFDSEFLGFKNFHAAKGTAYKDWQAAWRTWCDKAVEFGRSGTGGKGSRQSEGEKRDAFLAALTGGNGSGSNMLHLPTRDIDGECSHVA